MIRTYSWSMACALAALEVLSFWSAYNTLNLALAIFYVILGIWIGILASVFFVIGWRNK